MGTMMDEAAHLAKVHKLCDDMELTEEGKTKWDVALFVCHAKRCVPFEVK